MGKAVGPTPNWGNNGKISQGILLIPPINMFSY